MKRILILIIMGISGISYAQQLNIASGRVQGLKISIRNTLPQGMWMFGFPMAILP